MEEQETIRRELARLIAAVPGVERERQSLEIRLQEVVERVRTLTPETLDALPQIVESSREAFQEFRRLAERSQQLLSVSEGLFQKVRTRKGELRQAMTALFQQIDRRRYYSAAASWTETEQRQYLDEAIATLGRQGLIWRILASRRR